MVGALTSTVTRGGKGVFFCVSSYRKRTLLVCFVCFIRTFFGVCRVVFYGVFLARSPLFSQPEVSFLFLC